MANTQFRVGNRYFKSTIARAGIVLSVIFVLSGCSESSRCLGGAVPQFDTDVLANPVLNQVYAQVIRASVKNSVEDDLYRYSFSLSGELPEGLSSRQDDRRFFFQGTPTILGVFPLELTVTLGDENNLFDYGDADELCRRTATVAYELIVDAM